MPYQIKLENKNNGNEQQQNTHIYSPLSEYGTEGLIKGNLVIPIDKQGTRDFSRSRYGQVQQITNKYRQDKVVPLREIVHRSKGILPAKPTRYMTEEAHTHRKP